MKNKSIAFYPEDFLSGVSFMNDKQVGQYIKLLCLQFKKGTLDKEDMESVSNNDKKVLEKFSIDENGNYFNERMANEMVKRQIHAEKQREKVMKRWHKNDSDNVYHGNTAVIPYVDTKKKLSSNTKRDRESVREKERYFDDTHLNDTFNEFLKLRTKLKAVNTERAVKLLISKLEDFDDNTKLQMIEQSIENSWKGLFEIKNNKGGYENNFEKGRRLLQ